MTFDDFWTIYPRKVAKRAALVEWQKEIRRGTDPCEIIKGLRRQLAALAAKDPQFIPHARTWLHQGRWEDEPEPVPYGQPTTLSAAQSIIERLERESEREGQDQGHEGHFHNAQLLPSTGLH